MKKATKHEGRFYTLLEPFNGLPTGTILKLVRDDGTDRPRFRRKGSDENFYPSMSTVALLDESYEGWGEELKLPQIGSWETRLSEDRKTLHVGCQTFTREDVEVVYQRMKKLREEAGLPV